MKEEKINIRFDRVPPQDVDAERAVLGGLLISDGGNDAIPKVVDILGDSSRDKVFYKETHQKIYNAILSLFDNGEPADLITLTKELDRRGDLERIDIAYLDEMIDSVPNVANIEHYAHIVYDQYLRRNLIVKAVNIYESAFDADITTDSLYDEITDIKGDNGNKPRKEKTIETAVEFLAREKSKTPYIIDGILPATGFTSIAGFTGMGKSSLAMQMMLSILAGLPFLNTFKIMPADYHILYLNLENSEYTIDRLLNSQLTEFKISHDNLSRLYLPSCMAMSIDNRQDVKQISKWIEDYHIDIIVIDPILDAFTGDQNDLTVVRKLIKQFRDIDSTICWVLLHHFKKGNDDDDLIQLMLGSVGFANAMTSIMGLRRFSRSVNPAYKKIEFGKTRDSALPEDIKVCMNPVTRIFEIATSGEVFKPASIEVVLDILEKGSLAYTVLVTQVEMTQGISERTAKNLVQNALKLHKVKVNNGLYSLNKQVMPSYLEQSSMFQNEKDGDF